MVLVTRRVPTKGDAFVSNSGQTIRTLVVLDTSSSAIHYTEVCSNFCTEETLTLLRCT